ncbi:MAG: TetR/AcrR family transcriptional regulator [Ramlibacter sp.]|nr:TetR/AcrR family transcriptional regulator [Ramlibacter sp.]MDB5913602.1 TetR/AcrR family transcriptional regulator [Ramlibacter sp.]
MPAIPKRTDCDRPADEAEDLTALGPRERGKRDKQRRIAAAARQVFLEKGYDAATTREIAAQAGVSIGTVFVYARDKRDLLLMVVNDELDALTERGQRWVERPGPLLDRLAGFFAERYRYWLADPALARPTLEHTYDLLGEPGEPAEGSEPTQRFFARRRLMLAQLKTMVLQAQAAGEAAPDLDAERVASLFMALYVSEQRRWMQQAAPEPAAGIRQLRETLALVMRGVGTQG